MSVRLKITSRTGVYLSLSLMTGLAVSTTYAFAQYTQMASNNAPSGMARTATIQECAQACAANTSCGSFVYYTQAAMANVCQLTSSQTPMNIVGAISGVPYRNQQPEKAAATMNNGAGTTNANYQTPVRGQGNYAVTPITYGQTANTPNWNPKPVYQPQQQAPVQQQKQTPQSGAISFVRPQNTPQQQSQVQKYNPQPQYQQQANYQPEQYKPTPVTQTPQYKPMPVTQVQTYTPAPTQQMPQPVTQQQTQNLRPAPAQQPQYYSATNTVNSANDVNYQSHSRQAVPEYSVARATEQANQQILQQQASQQRTEAAVEQTVKQANLGPLRPPVKTQMEYDKYRDKDGMVDAAAMRRDMLKNENSPRYSVESEWAGIAQNTEANQAAKIYENSAPVPLPPEINEKDLLTEDSSDSNATKTKKKSIFSKIFKRELDEYAEPATEDVAINSQNDGPLRRK